MAMEYACPQCDREFASSVGLQAHIRQAHPPADDPEGDASTMPESDDTFTEPPSATATSPWGLCTVNLTGPNQTGGVREFSAGYSVAEVMEAFELDGDVYQSNRGEALDQGRSLLSLGGGDIFLTVR